MNTSEQLRNVLVAVDVQNDFITGSLKVTEGARVVPPLNEVAAATRAVNGNVLFTRDWHPALTQHFDAWPEHCIAGTNGAAFHPRLDVQPDDVIISKGTEQTHGYSAWEGSSDTGTTLEYIIEPQTDTERVRVFIGGLATDYCVKATALDVADHFKDDERVQLFLLRDAIRAVNRKPVDGDEAVRAMRDAGLAAITSAEARAMIEQGHTS